MATRSIVPRADGEGSVGTSAKAWDGVWAKKFNGADLNLFYLVRLNSTAYIVGDIAFSPSLPSAMFLKCIEAGTTAATEPDYTGAAVGGTVTDGTVVWQYYDLLSGSGVPLGTILPYSGTGDTPPYGFLFFEGQAVSRTMYADYFELVGTTYGEGDGENTFNIPNLIEAAMLNGSYTKTSYTTAGSATFTAPKTGWYKITAKGGGGGGQGGSAVSGQNTSFGGAGGGEGGTTIAYEKMDAGDTATVVIGAGGAGGAAGASIGTAGGDSSVTINNNTYTASGGGAGIYAGGAGGNGTIIGCAGVSRKHGGAGARAEGGSGGGAGGAITEYSGTPVAATQGGGGAGGSAISNSSSYAGGAGGDGYVWIEYIGVSMKYIGKVYDAPTPSSAQIDLSQYAQDLANRLQRQQVPAFNKRDVITVSGTYTAPVTGWYRIVVKGGGGGGGGGSTAYSGGGGGGGGTTIAYEKMTAGQTASVVIGAGGTGGGIDAFGTAGGNTTVTVNSKTYTGGGGSRGAYAGGAGGTGDVMGMHGGQRIQANSGYSLSGGIGGDNGGAGGDTGTSASAGYAGTQGYAWFEYFDPTLM